MLETITSVNGVVNGIVWGPVGLALLFGTGFVMSVRTVFFQFGHFRYWLRNTIGAIFTDRDITAHTEKNDKAISQFQSLCTALAATPRAATLPAAILRTCLCRSRFSRASS